MGSGTTDDDMRWNTAIALSLAVGRPGVERLDDLHSIPQYYFCHWDGIVVETRSAAVKGLMEEFRCTRFEGRTNVIGETCNAAWR